MTEILRDSTNAFAIPADTPYVGGYVDGIYMWSAAAWQRFANARKRTICVNPASDGNTCDAAAGDRDFAPGDVAPWVQRQLARGEPDIWVYTNRVLQKQIENLMEAAGIAPADASMWIGTLDGTQVVARYKYPIAAVQYVDTGGYDESVVYQTFGPGGGTIGGEVLEATDPIVIGLQNGIKSTYDELQNIAGGIASLNTTLQALKAEVDTLKAAQPSTPKSVSGSFTGTVT